MICCGFVHNFCRISLVISLSTQYLGLSTGYYVSFFLYFSMKCPFIHNFHIRCKDNKFISFAAPFSWKSFLIVVYKLVDIHRDF